MVGFVDIVDDYVDVAHDYVDAADHDVQQLMLSVSYTHLTLPTKA